MRLILDVDGVLADFVGGALEVLNDIRELERLGAPLTHEDVKVWKVETLLPEVHRAEFGARIRRPGFCADLAPLPGAIEFVDSVAWRANIVIATTPLPRSAYWRSERIDWLRRHFGDRVAREIHFLDDKSTTRGDVFVDDKPENVADWAEARRGVALLWDRPYNRSSAVTRVRSDGRRARVARAHTWADVNRALDRARAA